MTNIEKIVNILFNLIDWALIVYNSRSVVRIIYIICYQSLQIITFCWKVCYSNGKVKTTESYRNINDIEVQLKMSVNRKWHFEEN